MDEIGGKSSVECYYPWSAKVHHRTACPLVVQLAFIVKHPNGEKSQHDKA